MDKWPLADQVGMLKPEEFKPTGGREPGKQTALPNQKAFMLF